VTDPILRLEPDRVSVAPGSHDVVTLTIHNPGTIVEGYDLDVVGEIPLPWITVTPAFVSVYPQQDATATVMFSPPAGGVAASGTIPFGVRARSQVDATSSAVAEGDVEVAQLLGLQAKLTPVTSTGRWRGRHTISISNWGNSPARLRLVVSDPDEQLGFLVYPETLNIPLGGTATARLKAKTRKPTLRGTPRQLPFEVIAERDPAPPVVGPVSAASTPDRPVLRGFFAQKPILSRGVVGLAAGALVVALVGGAAAYVLSHGSDSGAVTPPVITQTVQTTINGTLATVTMTITSSASQSVISLPTTSDTSVTDGSDGTPVGLQAGQWVALAGVYPGATSLSDNPEAQALWTALETKGAKDIGYFDSVTYPGLLFGGNPILTQSLVIYVGPYATPGDAASACKGYLPDSGVPICQEGQIPSAESSATTTPTQ
jgi:hypothetical protein